MHVRIKQIVQNLSLNLHLKHFYGLALWTFKTCILMLKQEKYMCKWLQPLSPVLFYYLPPCSIFIFNFCIMSWHYLFCSKSKRVVCLLPAELSNPSKQYQQHSWRIFFSSKSSWKVFPSSCKSYSHSDIVCYMFLEFVSQDYSRQPPSQELIARDVHDNE